MRRIAKVKKKEAAFDPRPNVEEAFEVVERAFGYFEFHRCAIDDVVHGMDTYLLDKTDTGTQLTSKPTNFLPGLTFCAWTVLVLKRCLDTCCY